MEIDEHRVGKALRLLQITGTLDPANGGTAAALTQLTKSMEQLGNEVDVVTLDPQSSEWLRGQTMKVTGLGPAHLGSYAYSSHLRRWLSDNVSKYDVVIVHGIWRYLTHAVSRACINAGTPYFVFAHGALDPWFRERYPLKHAKKQLYWSIFEHRALSRANAVFFTQEAEQTLARQSFSPYSLKEAVVPIGIDEPPHDDLAQKEKFLSQYPDLRGKRLVLFLSRLHPKKGCDLLIEAFARVASHDESLQLVMAGPDDGEYEAELQALSQKLGIADRVTWPGMLTGDVKWGAYRAADVFALISHSENFGIVVAEALACSLPVLTTNKVNIWQEIRLSGGGLIGTNTADSAETLLREWLSRSDSERNQMRKMARTCFLDHFGAESAAINLTEFINSQLEIGQT